MKTFVDLLDSAINEPGIISKAYSTFHGYSIGNRLLAMLQCEERGIAPGPIATFMGWKEKGRFVQKGQKAIVLCMPITGKRVVDGEDDHVYTRFVFKPNWFVLSQTAGEDVAPIETGSWDAARALTALDIVEVPFAHLDGNCQGYASKRTIAVSPVAELPYKTRFHELAHVVLGHTAEADLRDGDSTPRDVCEVEAEAVALVCLESLGLPGAEHSRGYIQHWFSQSPKGETAISEKSAISERSAQRIFKAADAILKAGSEVTA